MTELEVPQIFGVPFKLTSEPPEEEDDIRRWELELFTCTFVMFHSPGRIAKDHQVIITKDTYRIHNCETLSQATAFLEARLKPSLDLCLSQSSRPSST